MDQDIVGNTGKLEISTSHQQLTRMGIGANFGRTVSRTDEPQPDGSVSSRVGVVVLVKHPCLQRERMQSSAPNQMTTGSPTTYTHGD